jgi:molybdate transport system substrate-binding protein
VPRLKDTWRGARGKEDDVANIKSIISVAPALAVLSVLLLAGFAQAAEIKVMNSGGFAAAYLDLIPEFERATGNTIKTAWGPSMGTAPDAIPLRLQRGEPVDVIIMVGYALGDLIKQGKIVADSRVDLARSKIGMAVRAGAPKPDISSVEAFKQALIAAKSIAYSDSASGVYVSTELFQRLGIAEELRAKSREIKGERVGNVVARGEAEIGFQQISELLPIHGIDFVGPIPAELQKITVFSAGIAVNAKDPSAAKTLLEFLASPAAIAAIKKSGLEPVNSASQN